MNPPQRVADHEARAGASQPKDGGGDLLETTQAPDRLIPQDCLHRLRFYSKHIGNHRRVDGARADRVDADAARCIFERGTSRQPHHAMLRGMVGRSTWQTYQAANRRAVDDPAKQNGPILLGALCPRTVA